MRILLVNNVFYRFGGVETCLFNQLKILEEHGHDLLYFCTAHPQNYRSNFAGYFIPYRKTPHQWNLLARASRAMNAIYSLQAKRNIRKLLKDHRPDIVHIHDIQRNISPSIIDEIKQFNIPIVKTLHSPRMVCAGNALFNFSTRQICEKCKDARYYNMIVSKCINGSLTAGLSGALEMCIHHQILHIFDKVDLFISPSQFYIKKLKEMGFKRKIIYIPNPIFIEDNFLKQDLMQKSIVYFGRLSKEKGLDVLLDAVKRLEIQLKIIGFGIEEKFLKQKVQTDKIKNVNFLGGMDEYPLKKEISQSLFTVLPSIWYENCPYTILESFALGKPVIGSNIGGIPELIKDGERGFLYKAGNYNDLRTKISRLLSDQKLIITMGKNARQWMEEEFDNQNYYDRLMHEYYIL